MNRKQLILILVIVVVVGGLGWWLRHRNVSSYRTTQGRMGQKVLGEFDLNNVAQVLIKHGTNELNLVRQEEQWTVRERGSYPANFSEVSEFLRKVWELKVVQPVTVGQSQLARLELTPPGKEEKSGTLVELKDKNGKAIKTILLGKKHLRQSERPSPYGGDEGWPDGRYLMIDNQPQSVSLVSETFGTIEPKPDQWLNKDFFKVEKVKSVAVTYPAATNSWKLARETETGEMNLLDAKPEEKVDSAKVSAIPNALSYPSFNDVATNAQPEETGLDKPTVAMLETFDNFTYTVKVGKKTTEENSYLTVAVSADIPPARAPGKDEKPADKEKLDKEFKEKTDKLKDKLKQEKNYEKATYLVSKWTLDSLLKERHQLLAEKKEVSTNAPAVSTPLVSAPATNAFGAANAPAPALAPTNAPALVSTNPPKMQVPPRKPLRTNQAVKPPLPPLPPLPPEPKLDQPAKPADKKEPAKP
jgi:hypothetical protein